MVQCSKSVGILAATAYCSPRDLQTLQECRVHSTRIHFQQQYEIVRPILTTSQKESRSEQIATQSRPGHVHTCGSGETGVEKVKVVWDEK
ncbi:hypothetical protein Y032_0653g1167 [Ancylostoma ceylanicum]|uniref:Uncharacterized protein n=1 Tax=Ancylostoma ceylanicum TaxID=53326 RepID=A0A016WKE5_9BILA|nr:hypothetical protein Y032_0653g1167 [Ancylostoma ceylanicum]